MHICDGRESQLEKKKQQQSLGTSLFSGVLSINKKTHVFLTLSSFVVHTTVFSENIVNIFVKAIEDYYLNPVCDLIYIKHEKE